MDINLDISEIDRVSDEIKEVLEYNFDTDIEEIIIYGSFGGRASSSDSDVDLLVVVPPSKEDDIVDMNHMLGGMALTVDDKPADFRVVTTNDKMSFLKKAVNNKPYSTFYSVTESEFHSM